MADHAHKQIRDALKLKLTGLSLTGNRVFANRVWPLNGNELPAIRLFTEEEEIEQTGLAGQFRQHRLIVSVEACAKANITLDDTLDAIGKDIEIALSSGLTLGTKTLYPTYLGMTLDQEELDQPVGIKRHRFAITYANTASQPDTV